MRLYHKIMAILFVPLLITTGCKEEAIESAVFTDAGSEPYVAEKSLSSTEILDNSVTLSWQKATNNGTIDPALRYQIYFSTKDNLNNLNETLENGSPFDEATADIDQKKVVGLASGTLYYFNLAVSNTANIQAAYRMAAYETTSGGSTDGAHPYAPKYPATGLTFTDEDLDQQQLAGTITISRALSEEDLTHYHLYWGSNGSTKLNNNTIVKLGKTGSDLTYVLPANTARPSSALYFLVFTYNSYGEMDNGSSLYITDFGIPTNAPQAVAFTDTKGGPSIKGDVIVTRAANEIDVDSYNLYWSSDGSSKLAGSTMIASMLVGTAGNTVHSFTVSTTPPAGATHFYLVSSNRDGEMTSGVGCIIQ